MGLRRFQQSLAEALGRRLSLRCFEPTVVAMGQQSSVFLFLLVCSPSDRNIRSNHNNACLVLIRCEVTRLVDVFSLRLHFCLSSDLIAVVRVCCHVLDKVPSAWC